jgi:hypothetical protein
MAVVLDGDHEDRVPDLIARSTLTAQSFDVLLPDQRTLKLSNAIKVEVASKPGTSPDRDVDIFLSEQGSFIAALQVENGGTQAKLEQSRLAEVKENGIFKPDFKAFESFHEGVLLALLALCTLPYLVKNIPGKGGKAIVGALAAVYLVSQLPYELEEFANGNRQLWASVDVILPSMSYVWHYTSMIIYSCLYAKIAFECSRRLFPQQARIFSRIGKLTDRNRALGISILRGSAIGTSVAAAVSFCSAWICYYHLGAWSVLDSLPSDESGIGFHALETLLGSPINSLLLVLLSCSVSRMWIPNKALSLSSSVVILTYFKCAIFIGLFSESSLGSSVGTYTASFLVAIALTAAFTKLDLVGFYTMLLAGTSFRELLPFTIVYRRYPDYEVIGANAFALCMVVGILLALSPVIAAAFDHASHSLSRARE